MGLLEGGFYTSTFGVVGQSGYDLFSVTKERTEVVIEGSDYSDMENPKWLEYEFKCKPGNVSRAPCLISPYHYRLVSGLSVHQA